MLIRRAVAALLLVFVLGACAQSGYDARKIQSELRRAGATAQQARCVTDALENNFDPNRLGAHSEPTLAELQSAHALLQKCGVRASQPR